MAEHAVGEAGRLEGSPVIWERCVQNWMHQEEGQWRSGLVETEDVKEQAGVEQVCEGENREAKVNTVDADRMPWVAVSLRVLDEDTL